MARRRLTNAEFHKFLNEFSEEVSKGKYRKMPYDKYRTFRNWYDTSVDIILENYTNLNGKIVQRIRISPDDPTGYEFYIDDGSFGNFCYDCLKMEETKMHPDNEKKTMYDLFGEVNYATKADRDETAKAALHEYWAEKALNDNCSTAACAISSADNDSNVIIYAGDPVCGWADAASTVSADLSTHIETDLDVVKGRLDVIEADNHKQYNDIADLRHCKADVEYLYCVEEDLLGKIDELHCRSDELVYLSEEQYHMIQDLTERVNEVEKKAFPVVTIHNPEISWQSTSSEAYPRKNYKINIAGGVIDEASCSDNRKENENMDTNKMFNFDFGPVTSNVRMSPYGLALKNAEGKYVSFDKNTATVVDVEVFNFDAQKFLFKMPVPLSQVQPGDIIVHMRKPMFVYAVNGNTVAVIDIYNAEAKSILPVHSPFGFNFMTKIVSLIDMTSASAENPFGNMLPFLLMGDEDADLKEMLPLLLMTGNANMFGNMAQNPLMLYALMGNDGGKIDPLMLVALTGGFNQGQVPVAQPARPVPAQTSAEAPADEAPAEHTCNC